MSTGEEIRAERIKKLEELKQRGIETYPATSGRTHSGTDFLGQFDALAGSEGIITLAGRLMSIRKQGGIAFADLYDGTVRVQVVVQQEILGEENFATFADLIEPGDFIDATGTAFTTKRGQQSLKVTSWRVLTKAIMPIPDAWFGIKDDEMRYRERYLDILLNPELHQRFIRRSKFWSTIRQFYLERGYIEVETPVIETTPGGADARPFVTHHNALDIDAYLRISCGELWQKRLLVAGFPKIFEVGRIFRNEGMSFEHAQDYTQWESYEAFADFNDGMKMIRELYIRIANEVYGKTTFTVRDLTFDLSHEWEIIDYCEILDKNFGVNPLTATTEDVAAALEKAGMGAVAREPGFNVSRGTDQLWKSLRKTIAGPNFLVGIPKFMEPLAKESLERPGTVERFQVVFGGAEVGKGFSELNDPIDQRERFEEQQKMRDAGDEEAQFADMDYVRALEYGMPPAFGFGMSERLFSFLEGVSIREAQVFPLMRPK